MHNWLIFQYHRVRVHAKTSLLRGWASFGMSRSDPRRGGKQ
jgi:hypothetical protein